MHGRSESREWSSLEASASPVVAIDFGSFGGFESFEDIARSRVGGYRWLRLPAPGLACDPAADLSTTAYVDSYERHLAASGTASPVAIVGYCIGGVYAYDLAVRLEQHGRPPHCVILVDTFRPSLPQVMDQLLRTFVDIGWSKEDPMGVDAPQLVADVEVLLGCRDPAGAVAQLHAAASRFIRAMLSRQGLAPKVLDRIATDMSDRCRAWLRYVVASTVREEAHFGGITHVFIDAGRPVDSYELAAGLETTLHKISSDGGYLLGSPSCGAQLESCLAGAGRMKPPPSSS